MDPRIGRPWFDESFSGCRTVGSVATAKATEELQELVGKAPVYSLKYGVEKCHGNAFKNPKPCNSSTGARGGHRRWSSAVVGARDGHSWDILKVRRSRGIQIPR